MSAIPANAVRAVPVLVDTSTTEGSDDAWTVNRSQVSGTPAGICGVVGDFQATGAQVLIDGDPVTDDRWRLAGSSEPHTTLLIPLPSSWRTIQVRTPTTAALVWVQLTLYEV